MKLFLTALLAVALTTLVHGAPAAGSDNEAFEVGVSKLLAREPSSCDDCNDHYDLCIKYGVANDHQTACDKVCMKHLCMKWPDCRHCSDKLNQCPAGT